jgi:hypothetical protein
MPEVILADGLLPPETAEPAPMARAAEVARELRQVEVVTAELSPLLPLQAVSHPLLRLASWLLSPGVAAEALVVAAVLVVTVQLPST